MPPGTGENGHGEQDRQRVGGTSTASFGRARVTVFQRGGQVLADDASSETGGQEAKKIEAKWVWREIPEAEDVGPARLLGEPDVTVSTTRRSGRRRSRG